MVTPRAYIFWHILFLGWLLSAWILECAGQDQAANRFDQFDLNQDGQLTREELPYRRLFQRLDRDGDGLVSRQEASRHQGRSRSVQHPAIDRESWAKITDAPTPLTPGELGLGRQIPDLAYTTLDGKTGSLQALAAEGGGVVIAMTSATCPVSKRYLPRLLAIHDLPVLLVNPFRSESCEQIKAGWPADLFPAQYVHDLDQVSNAIATAASRLSLSMTRNPSSIGPVSSGEWSKADRCPPGRPNRWKPAKRIRGPMIHPSPRKIVTTCSPGWLPTVERSATPPMRLHPEATQIAGASGSPTSSFRSVENTRSRPPA